MLIGACVLFTLVLGLFALALFKPNWRWSEAAGWRWIIWGGLAMPISVLTALLVYALWGGERLLAHPQTPDLVVVEARAERWRWVFSYPDRPQTPETVGVLHIPADRPVDVVIRSADVIHSFWIPRLAGKLDAIPGHENRLRIQADVPGIYAGQCSEYCGIGHQSMQFRVEAHSIETYDAVLAGQPVTSGAGR